MCVCKEIVPSLGEREHEACDEKRALQPCDRDWQRGSGRVEGNVVLRGVCDLS